MVNRRQRKAATQRMHDLGDGTSPEGGGQILAGLGDGHDSSPG